MPVVRNLLLLVGSGAQLIVQVRHIMSHGAPDISSCDVYGFNIVIVKVDMIVFGRLKKIDITLIYGLSEVGLCDRLAHLKVRSKILMTSLH